MDKQKRKEILNQLAEKKLAEFRKDLPIGESVFLVLFDNLDIELGKHNCDHTTKLTEIFLAKNNIENKNTVIEWFADNGGFCDCEILANVEDIFEYLNKNEIKSVSKTQVKLQKQKLNRLKTDFGFCIEIVPSPWTLTETILNNNSIYSFQIGKGSDCIINLEKSFPSEQFDKDIYWLNFWTNETELNYKIEDLTVERIEMDNFFCLLVKTKNWTPVFYWFRNKFTDKWFLKMKTELGRHKSDFKEVQKLLKSISNEEK